MAVLAIVILIVVIGLLQQLDKPGQRRRKAIASVAMFILATVLLCMEFGRLRGIFICIALTSLLGTLFTLLQHKLIKS